MILTLSAIGDYSGSKTGHQIHLGGGLVRNSWVLQILIP